MESHERAEGLSREMEPQDVVGRSPNKKFYNMGTNLPLQDIHK